MKASSLNHIFRVIWSEAQNAWIAVSEIAPARGKRASCGINVPHEGAAGGFPGSYRLKFKSLLVMLACCLSLEAQANPTGAQVVSGQATFNQVGNTLNITNTPGAILNWQSFSIGSKETTNFIQQSASSSVLNRVAGTDPSAILGTLTSNGRVFLINPAGILVGAGATINTAGFVASALNISNADFAAGRMNFTATPNAGSVTNEGTITTPEGGTVYLIAPQVQNSGIITTPQGQTILAAGSTVTLMDTATPGVTVQVTGSGTQATNLGQILADSGQIGVLGAVIKNSGTLSASSLVNKGGRIFLQATQSLTLDPGGAVSADGTSGGSISAKVLDANGNLSGNISVDGTLSAQGTSATGAGGLIETSAASVNISDTANVSTKAANGLTGSWLLDPYDFTIASSGGDITGSALSSLLGSNSVTIETSSGTNTSTNLYASTSGSGNINVNDTVSWSAHTLTLDAAGTININTATTGSGTATLVLNSSGTVNPTVALAVPNLVLLGTGGNYQLGTYANTVGTLAANTGTVNFSNNAALTIGNVNSTQGITASSGVTISTSAGDITVSAPISAAGNVQINAQSANATITNSSTITSTFSESANNATGGVSLQADNLILTNGTIKAANGQVVLQPYSAYAVDIGVQSTVGGSSGTTMLGISTTDLATIHAGTIQINAPSANLTVSQAITNPNISATSNCQSTVYCLGQLELSAGSTNTIAINAPISVAQGGLSLSAGTITNTSTIDLGTAHTNYNDINLSADVMNLSGGTITAIGTNPNASGNDASVSLQPYSSSTTGIELIGTGSGTLGSALYLSDASLNSIHATQWNVNPYWNSTGATIQVDASVVYVDAYGGFELKAGTGTLTNNGSLTMQSGINKSINLTADNMVLDGGTISAPTGIVQVSPGTLSDPVSLGGTVSETSGGTLGLDNTALASITAEYFGVMGKSSNSGSVATLTGAITVTGAGAAFPSITGAVVLENTGGITIDGVLSAGTAGVILLADGSYINGGTSNSTTTPTLHLATSPSAGVISDNGSDSGSGVSAAYLVTVSDGGTSLTGSGNAVAKIDALETGTGNITIKDNYSSLAITNAGTPLTNMPSTGIDPVGTVTVSNSGNIVLQNSVVTADAGSVSLTSTGGSISGSGLINTATLTTNSATGTTLNGSNVVGTFNATNTTSGDIVFNNTEELTITGISNSGGGSITVTANGAITKTGTVTANGGGAITLTNTSTTANTAVQTIASITGSIASTTSATENPENTTTETSSSGAPNTSVVQTSTFTNTGGTSNLFSSTPPTIGGTSGTFGGEEPSTTTNNSGGNTPGGSSGGGATGGGASGGDTSGGSSNGPSGGSGKGSSGGKSKKKC